MVYYLLRVTTLRLRNGAILSPLVSTAVLVKRKMHIVAGICIPLIVYILIDTIIAIYNSKENVFCAFSTLFSQNIHAPSTHQTR